MNQLINITDNIINGKRLDKTFDYSLLLQSNLTDLSEQADRLRAHFCGDRIDLCTIINGKSGRCSEDCRYCAQSAHHHTSCEVYDFLDSDKIVANAKENEKAGVHRFSIVTSGHHLNDQDFEKALDTYRALKDECSISLCGSHGFLNEEQFKQLKEAGVTSYHCNIETSEHYFPQICTTHSFADKLANIKRAQATGFRVCSGGIIGMGESWQDRIDMALTLADLGITSIPLNIMVAIPGTPLEKMPPLSEEDILRTVALFRFINPAADIRLAGGRSLLSHQGKAAFCGGASATITGNLLTTTGATVLDDKKMFSELGRSF